MLGFKNLGKLLFGLSMVLVSCKNENSPIVIPPGGQILYTSKNFVYYSDDRYSVLLREPTDDNKLLKTVIDITPAKSDSLDPNLVHKKISPKTIALTGPFVIQVTMDYHDTKLYAFLFDQKETASPSLQTTLLYQILASYPGKSIKAYTATQLKTLQKYIDNFTESRKTAFGLSDQMNPDLLYRFYRNGLANNIEFFELLKTVGVHFNYDSTGDVLTAPFPFGSPNNAPVLNAFTSTAPGLVVGKEGSLLEITAEAQDIDKDMLFYVWKQGGEIIQSDTQLYSWTPSPLDGGGDNYDLQVLITDGGKILDVQWELMIQDFNRKPSLKGGCAPTATEKKKWTCTLTGEDPDLDALSWIVGVSGNNATVKMNGVDAPGSVTGDTLVLEVTPNNADAKSGSMFINVRLDDGKYGFALRSVNLTIFDVNSAPYVVGSGIIPTNVLQPIPLEYDSCLLNNPENSGDFTFDLMVEDPDNLDPETIPPDVITAEVSGNFGSSLSQLPPTITPTRTTFHFIWRPTHLNKSGTFIVTLKDDHGSLVPPQTISITAKDVNQVPCLTAGATSLLNNDAFQWAKSRTVSATFQDGDYDVPYVEAYNIPGEILPHLNSCNTTTMNQPIVTTKLFGQSAYVYSTKEESFSFCLRNSEESVYGTTIRLTRPAPGSGDVVLNAGTSFSTDFAGTGIRVNYEMPITFTISADVESLLIPVTPVSRSSGAHTLTIIENPGILSSNPGVTVTNPSPVANHLAKATFSIPAPVAHDVYIPSGLRLKTNESLNPSVPTLRYEVVLGAVIPAGSTSVSNVDIARVNFKVPIGAITQHGPLNDGSFVVTNTTEGYSHIGGIRYKYKADLNVDGDARYCFDVKSFDGALAKPGEINQAQVLAAMPGAISVSNPSSFFRNGTLTVNRGSTSSALTLNPVDFIFSTANYKRYRLTEASTFDVGVSSINVPIERVMDSHPDAAKSTYSYCVRYRDHNFPPIFTSATFGQVLEGGALLGLPILVTDNTANPLLAQDLDDRYSFNIVSSPGFTVPAGPYLLCRSPAASLEQFSADCVPCNTTAGLTHHQTRSCYLRFRPNLTDIAKTFQFKVRVNDQGFHLPINTNVRDLTISINVKEVNDPSYFTDGSWNTLADGDTQSNPVNLGTASEGSESQFFVYAMDPDISYDYKKLSFSLYSQVYDVKDNVWRPKPSGLSISVSNYEALPISGSKNTAVIKWTPTDADAKQFSTAEGFVIRVTSFDALTEAAVRRNVDRYFLLKVLNKNNPPEILPLNATNSYTVLADSYWKITFQVQDIDSNSPIGLPFQSELSACQNSEGMVLSYVPIDGVLSSPAYDCHVSDTLWEDEIFNFDPNYQGNRNVGASQCRTGSGESDLNVDLAVPKLTRLPGRSVVNGKVVQTYQLEWCPQKSQLGKFNSTLVVSDNGDYSRSNILSPSYSTTSPLTLNVVSSVYFKSPRLDLSGQPEHFMAQTAAGLSATPFIYKTIVENSKKNPLSYQLISSPRQCGLAHGMCIDAQGVITWVPSLVTDLTDPGDPNTWHRVEVKVTDNVTGEYDLSHFYLQVQDPLAPTTEVPPSAVKNPNVAQVFADERESVVLQAIGADGNTNDVLFYRWYVNGNLVSDEGDEFTYRPGYQDGTTDPDGSGPLKIGEHKVQCEVTDGNSKVTVEWIIKVKNVYPVPTKVFDVVSARSPITVSEVVWNNEVSVHTAIGSDKVDYLLFAGRYRRGTSYKNYGWSLQFINSILIPTWNFYEDLPWATGQVSTNVSFYKPNSSSYEAYFTPQTSRSGPFSSTTNSVKLVGNFSAIPVPLTNSQKCTGVCARNHYTGGGNYGIFPRTLNVNSGQYLFYTNPEMTTISWDKNTDTPKLFYTAPTGYKIVSLEYHPGHNRLYAVERNAVTLDSRIRVFDGSPTLSGSNPGGALYTIPIFDGIPGHELSAPVDTVLSPSQNKLYVFLSGTGGLAVLSDSGAALSSSDLSFVGVNEIEASPGDQAMTGKRLAFNPNTGLIFGVSREGQQVFTVDTANGMKVYRFSTPEKIASVLVVPESGLTLLVARDSSSVFVVR